MSTSEHRTRIEFSSLELDVMEDALSYYQHVVDDDVSLVEESVHKADFLEALERRRALGRSLTKVSKARERTS